MKLPRFLQLSLVMKMRVKFFVVMLLIMFCAISLWWANTNISKEIEIIQTQWQDPAFNKIVVQRFQRIDSFEKWSHWAWWGLPFSLGLGIWFAVSLPQMGVLIETLRQTIDVMGRQTTEIKSVCIEQVQNSTEQAAAVQQATTSSEEIAMSARQISDRARDVEEVAQDTMTACDNGAKTVAQTIEAMQSIKNQVQSIAEAMVELGVNSQKIGGIVEIIDEISDQTNLLALNAAIEAAGAGEYGRRFAIVAVEVRRLAERTVEATKQIKALIENIQSHTNTTILMTEEGAKAVSGGSKMVNDVGDAFKNLISLIAKTTKAARDIHVATKQQTTASEQMAETIVEVKSVVDRVLYGAKDIQHSLHDLNEHSERLMEIVGEVSNVGLRSRRERMRRESEEETQEETN